MEQTLEGWVQTLLQHSHRRFFHVLMDTPSAEHDASRPLMDQRRVDEILAQLPVEDEFNYQDQQQPLSFRDTPVWLISTGIYGFVDECRKAGMPPEELSPLLSTAVARSSPLTMVTQRWLGELSKQLPTQGNLLRCKVVSIDP